jgi:dephospho-CoA kinase
MVRVGITGGIGSGKSLVCKVFECLGVPVYYADNRAKEIMNEDYSIITTLEGKFGKSVYKNGILDKKLLAQIIFSDKSAVEFVNSLVHPAVEKDFMHWSEYHNKSEYCIQEAALLFESGIYKKLDHIVTVVCPIEERVKRVIKRDSVSTEQVLARINNQWNDEQKIKLSDYLIYNDNKNSLLNQILKLHNIFIFK